MAPDSTTNSVILVMAPLVMAPLPIVVMAPLPMGQGQGQDKSMNLDSTTNSIILGCYNRALIPGSPTKMLKLNF